MEQDEELRRLASQNSQSLANLVALTELDPNAADRKTESIQQPASPGSLRFACRVKSEASVAGGSGGGGGAQGRIDGEEAGVVDVGVVPNLPPPSPSASASAAAAGSAPMVGLVGGVAWDGLRPRPLVRRRDSFFTSKVRHPNTRTHMWLLLAEI